MSSSLTPASFIIHPDIAAEFGLDFLQNSVIPCFTAVGECLICEKPLGTRRKLTVVSTLSAEQVSPIVVLYPVHALCTQNGSTGFLGRGANIMKPATYRVSHAVIQPHQDGERILCLLLNPAVDQACLFEDRSGSGSRWLLVDPTNSGNRDDGWFRFRRGDPGPQKRGNPTEPWVGALDIRTGEVSLHSSSYTFTATVPNTDFEGATVYVCNHLAVPDATDKDSFFKFMDAAHAGALDIVGRPDQVARLN